MLEHLYKRKIIRDFLSLFSETKWNQVVICTLEYAILTLKLGNNLASLSLDDISNFVDELKEKEKKIESKKILKDNSKSIIDKTNLIDESNIKPPSKWRKGDDIVFKNQRSKSSVSKKNNIRSVSLKTSNNHQSLADSISLKSEIYPKWWGQNSKNKKIKNKFDQSISQKSVSSKKNNPIKGITEIKFKSKKHDESSIEESENIKVLKEKLTNKQTKKEISKNSTPTRNMKVFTNKLSSKNKIMDDESISSFNNKGKVNKYNDKKDIDNSLYSQSTSKIQTKRHSENVDNSEYSSNQPRKIENRANSKIKDYLEKDRKIYSLLKKSNFESNQDQSEIKNNEKSNFHDESNDVKITSSFNQEKNTFYRENLLNEKEAKEKKNFIPEKTNKSNFVIEFDKNLDVRNVKEKQNYKLHNKLSSSILNNSNNNTNDDLYSKVQDKSNNIETFANHHKNIDYSQEDISRNNSTLKYEQNIIKQTYKIDDNSLERNYRKGFEQADNSSDSINFIKKIQDNELSNQFGIRNVEKTTSKFIPSNNQGFINNDDNSYMNESDKLSSYAPSERTKICYQRENFGLTQNNSLIERSQVSIDKKGLISNLNATTNKKMHTGLLDNTKYSNENNYFGQDEDYIPEDQIDFD